MKNNKNKLQLTLVFLRRGNSVLLAMKKRGFGAGKWNGVGGKVESGETIDQALIRETEEEIGVTLEAYEKVADIVFDEFYKGTPTFMNVHVFVSSQWTGDPTESEEMKPEWFERESIPYEEMWSDDIFWLPAVLDGKKIQATFVLNEEDEITAHNVTAVKGF